MLRCRYKWLAALAVVAVISPGSFGQTLTQEELAANKRIDAAKALAQKIDDMVAARWKGTDIKPSQPADSYEFFRRLSLDLRGRIPELLELRNIQSDDGPSREEMIEFFLADPRSVDHFTNVWRDIMLPDKSDVNT